MMGALYEDVEKFFGDMFASYGKLVARFPVAFVAIPLTICSLLGFGLLNLKYEYHVDKLYAPTDSPAMADRHKLLHIFNDTSETGYYEHQQIHKGSHGTVIVTSSKGDNMTLDADALKEIIMLQNYIQHSINVQFKGQVYAFGDICAQRAGKCIIDGADVVQRIGNTSHCRRPVSYLDYSNITSYEVRILGVPTTANNNITYVSTEIPASPINIGCTGVNAARLKFILRTKTTEQKQISVMWERQFIREMKRYKTNVTHINVVFTVSDSLDIELYEYAGKDLRLFPITVVIMVIFAILLGSGGNWVSTHVLLAQMALVGTLMAILAAFGTVSMAGMPYVDICGLMPFMVIGIGMDHMFLLLSAWRQTNIRATIEERSAETFRNSAISIIVMSLTDLLVFCIGSTSPFLSIRYFCACSGLALLFCYFNQLTFFGGCLVLNANRVADSRHCVTCLTTKSRREMEEEGKPRWQILLCSGGFPRRAGEDDNPCTKVPRSYLSRSLLHGFVKTFVLILYILYLVFTILGATKMDVGFNLDDLVPPQSYLSEYIRIENKHFHENGPVIMFVLDEPVAYEDNIMQKRITEILRKASLNNYVESKTYISWLDDYMMFLRNRKVQSNKDDFISTLVYDFLPSHPQYENDIILDDTGKSVLTSRFYVFSQRLCNSSLQKDLMLKMREISHNTSLPLTIYSQEFIFYEHHVSILKQTILTVAVTIISMLLIALMFIPHPVAVTCVTISMVSVVVGMMGCFYFLRTPLSAIQTVQLLISVGLCLNFTVHISHSYMTATGKSRNERVSTALDKVGGTLVNGTTSLFLGIIMLAFGNSYVFTSFFKCLTIVILIGALHALVILPVLLSFIGPRRTSKPRVFIPISPSCRSINAEFHPIFFSANRGETPTTPDAPTPFPPVSDANSLPRAPDNLPNNSHFSPISEEPELDMECLVKSTPSTPSKKMTFSSLMRSPTYGATHLLKSPVRKKSFPGDLNLGSPFRKYSIPGDSPMSSPQKNKSFPGLEISHRKKSYPTDGKMTSPKRRLSLPGELRSPKKTEPPKTLPLLKGSRNALSSPTTSSANFNKSLPSLDTNSSSNMNMPAVLPRPLPKVINNPTPPLYKPLGSFSSPLRLFDTSLSSAPFTSRFAPVFSSAPLPKSSVNTISQQISSTPPYSSFPPKTADEESVTPLSGLCADTASENTSEKPSVTSDTLDTDNRKNSLSPSRCCEHTGGATCQECESSQLGQSGDRCSPNERPVCTVACTPQVTSTHIDNVINTTDKPKSPQSPQILY